VSRGFLNNSIIAQGLARYGYRTEAALVASSILQAATYFRNRLPEAFAGYPRKLTDYPRPAARRPGRPGLPCSCCVSCWGSNR
jgi:glycogen debranching enzyme